MFDLERGVIFKPNDKEFSFVKNKNQTKLHNKILLNASRQSLEDLVEDLELKYDEFKVLMMHKRGMPIEQI